MTRLGRSLVFIAALALLSSCASSNEPKEYDLTGFWSVRTTYSTDPSCALVACYVDSRMMIVQTGSTVEGWYRFRSGIPSDETPFVGTVQGDKLSVLINSGQVNFTGAVRFKILLDGERLQATNNGNTLGFTIEP